MKLSNCREMFRRFGSFYFQSRMLSFFSKLSISPFPPLLFCKPGAALLIPAENIQWKKTIVIIITVKKTIFLHTVGESSVASKSRINSHCPQPAQILFAEASPDKRVSLCRTVEDRKRSIIFPLGYRGSASLFLEFYAIFRLNAILLT